MGKNTFILRYEDIEQETAEKLARTLLLSNLKGDRFVIAKTKQLEKLTDAQLIKFLSDVEKAKNDRRAVILNFDIDDVLGLSIENDFNFLDILEVFGIYMEEE